MDKKYTIQIWDVLNIVFFIFSFITFIPFVVFLVLSLTNIENGFYLGMCGVFASLFSAFFIAIIVRIVDLQKKKDSEYKAFLLIKGYLLEILLEIERFFPQTKAFVKINENNTVMLPNGIVYYTDVENEEIREFIDFQEEYLVAKQNVEKKIKKCMNSPFFNQCNLEVVTLIATLQTNGFTRCLLNVSTRPPFVDEDHMLYPLIFKDVSEFETLFTDLSILLERNPHKKLRVLTEEEKNDYLEFINTKRELIKKSGIVHSGKAYMDSKRIT